MATVWPTLDAPSANNFLDHFGGGLLSVRWGSVVSGTGAVTVTDSYAQCDAPNNSAAFIYYKTKLDKTKSQLWRVCFNVETTAANYPFPVVSIVNSASAPTADTTANIQATQRLFWNFANPTGGIGSVCHYNDTGGSAVYWDTPSATWGGFGAGKYSVQPLRASDYYILGIEIDAANNRWRMMQWAKTYVAGYTFDQGWRLFALTDWVLWTSQQATTDLWLVLGRQYTDSATNRTMRFEWVDYCEKNGTTLFEGWQACKAASADGHTLRYVYSFDDRTYLPRDRTTNELSPTGAGFESFDLQAPNVIRDGAGTDWMVYWGWNGGGSDGVAIAKATSTGTSPQLGPWTRGASNPVLIAQAGETRVRYPFLFMDNMETDATKRWKIIYGVQRTSDSLEVYKLATSPGPPDTGTWTYRGTIIDKGGVGSKDANGVLGGGVVSVFYTLAGGYDVWYTGVDASNVHHLLHASGASLTALVKDTTDYFPPLATGTASLTANLTGRTVTVDSTTGFVQDGSVIFDQDANADNWSTSRVRKVISATQLELYHSLDGFTTVTPAKVRQLDASQSRGGQQMVKQTLADGSTQWRGIITIWGPVGDLGASYGALCEQNMLISHNATSITGANFALDQFYSPMTSRGFNNDLRSVENMGILLGPLLVDAAPTPSAGGGGGGGGAGRIAYPGANFRKRFHKRVSELVDATAEEMYADLTAKGMPTEVRKEAAAIVKPFADAKGVPAAQRVDWAALHAETAATLELISLWRKEALKREILADEEDILMLDFL